MQVHIGQITVVIQEDCCLAVTLLGVFDLDLGDKYRSDRLHMINWYSLYWCRRLTDGALVFRGLGAPWAIFHGAIEAPSSLGWLNLEEIPGK